MHAELVYWDAMTAEAVLPMMERSSPYDPGELDFSAGLNGLRERLVALRAKVSGSIADTLDGYVEYADALADVNRWAADGDH